MAHAKINYVEPGKPLGYRLGEPQGFRWLGPVDVDLDDLASGRQQEPGAIEQAAAFLRLILEDGPVPSADVLARAEDEGISKRTLHRAKAKIGVRSIKEDKMWLWCLSEDEAPKDAKR